MLLFIYLFIKSPCRCTAATFCALHIWSSVALLVCVFRKHHITFWWCGGPPQAACPHLCGEGQYHHGLVTHFHEGGERSTVHFLYDPYCCHISQLILFFFTCTQAVRIFHYEVFFLCSLSLNWSDWDILMNSYGKNDKAALKARPRVFWRKLDAEKHMWSNPSNVSELCAPCANGPLWPPQREFIAQSRNVQRKWRARRRSHLAENVSFSERLRTVVTVWFYDITELGQKGTDVAVVD